MAQFLAFVPKTPAFYVYVANARSSPKALRFKYMRRTRVRPQNPFTYDDLHSSGLKMYAF